MSAKRSATVIPFPTRADRSNRLLMRDKIEANAWGKAATRLGYDRVIICEQSGGPKPEESDFVLIYRVGECWAHWGAARQDGVILLWQCSDGVQAGLFVSMQAALDGIRPATAAPPAGVACR